MKNLLLNKLFSTSYTQIAVAVILICAGVFAVYMALYRRRLNAALNAGSGSGGGSRRSVSPPVMLAVLIFLAGIIISAYCLTKMHYVVTAEGSMLGVGGGIDIGETKFRAFPQSKVANTLIGDCTPGEDIKGYTKYEHTDGDIRFIYYADTSGCGIMPSLLIYAEYIGSEPFGWIDCALHIDNEKWSGKSFDMGGQLSEERGTWYSVENFFTTGSMTLRIYVDPDGLEELEKQEPSGTLYIDIEKAFMGDAHMDSDGEYYTESTAE